jgi:hypothetical protein
MRLLPLLLLLPCAACRASEAAPAARSASADACGPADQAALSLTARSTIPLPDSAAPAGLALLPDGSLVMAQRGSSGVTIRSPASLQERWIAAPEPLPVLALSGGELLGAGRLAVYRIDTSSGRVERLMEVPVRAGHIVSLAADTRTVWVGAGGLAAGAGAVYAVSRSRPGHWRHRPMAAPVRLVADGAGRAAAALTRAPHRVVFLDSALAATGTASPAPVRRGARGDDARFTQALVRLDCGRLLHVIADLRSDRRQLNVYGTTPGPRLMRGRTIVQPLGFVHAMQGRSLVAVTESRGRREVVVFEWYWQFNQEES